MILLTLVCNEVPKLKKKNDLINKRGWFEDTLVATEGQRLQQLPYGTTWRWEAGRRPQEPSYHCVVCGRWWAFSGGTIYITKQTLQLYHSNLHSINEVIAVSTPRNYSFSFSSDKNFWTTKEQKNTQANLPCKSVGVIITWCVSLRFAPWQLMGLYSFNTSLDLIHKHLTFPLAVKIKQGLGFFWELGLNSLNTSLLCRTLLLIQVKKFPK